MKSYSIVGFWKFKSNRIRQEDGSWKPEMLFGGGMAFSEAMDAVLFVRGDQGPWGYSGKYKFNGERVTITLDACIASEIEGQTFERNVKFLNDQELVFSGIESHTGRLFETHFVLAK